MQIIPSAWNNVPRGGPGSPFMQSSNRILCREQSKLNPSCGEIRRPRVCEFARKKEEERRPPSILTKKPNQSECKAMGCTITGGQKPSKVFFFFFDIQPQKKKSFCLRLDSGHDVISAHKEGKREPERSTVFAAKRMHFQTDADMFRENTCAG